MIARALAVTGLIIASDQWTKLCILRAFPVVGDGFVLIPGVLDIRHVQNSGAAWGMLQGRHVLLIVCAAAALIWMTAQMKRTFLPLRFGWVIWGLLTGGIIGNVIDRVWRGFVVDFIDVHGIHFPTFNVADAAISLGVVGLILSQWFQERQQKHALTGSR